VEQLFRRARAYAETGVARDAGGDGRVVYGRLKA